MIIYLLELFKLNRAYKTSLALIIIFKNCNDIV